ncbi:MAG: ribonuclease [Myxococcales bacterium]|nr:ribonuclease [Myxococcales bacterium]
MSSASCVRETRDLKGDDAWRTLAATGWPRLVRDAAIRLRAADGFSHARSLAFTLSLLCVQGLIALVGLAVEFGQADFSRTILSAIDSAVPGPAGALLERTFAQAQKIGLEHRFLPLLVGLAGTVVTATTSTAQLIRGFNRLYGIEKDGPFLYKYGRALALAVLVGGVLICGAAVLTWGRELPKAVDEGRVAWRVLRWPVALALAASAFGGILHWGPRRRQPQWSWLVFGGAIGVAGWTLVTVAFSVAFRLSSTFGRVYGALAGVVALQLWTFCSAVAVFYGAAVAAQLEAVRSGTEPRRD